MRTSETNLFPELVEGQTVTTGRECINSPLFNDLEWRGECDACIMFGEPPVNESVRGWCVCRTPLERT
ncbi:hypothetical protein HFX_1336 [Haloferax mediterranei ATCC 33500]|uniref:Uncharacterized protein n=1 Tax=Haloferax mediterranei (strain ATCC 33500 / DSM 1411 / JCM 8866 / NBRC 14739 / NCIMB 2177 / R-4) TaxID=523841 RepID=I3R487_HALMT|nr:hypothetical protein HFX_1336 [Haloferax mediterranei ATCC 33500]